MFRRKLACGNNFGGKKFGRTSDLMFSYRDRRNDFGRWKSRKNMGRRESRNDVGSLKVRTSSEGDGHKEVRGLKSRMDIGRRRSGNV